MLIACSIFRQKLPCWLSCFISTRVLDVNNRLLRTSEFLLSQLCSLCHDSLQLH